MKGYGKGSKGPMKGKGGGKGSGMKVVSGIVRNAPGKGMKPGGKK